jgi:hypothetical protein
VCACVCVSVCVSGALWRVPWYMCVLIHTCVCVCTGGQIARWLQRLKASYTSTLRPETYTFCTDITNRRADCSVAAAASLAEAA